MQPFPLYLPQLKKHFRSNQVIAIHPRCSDLGYHRVLSPTAGVRVSPLCLGAMNFGENWKQALGECTKETAFEMLDYFYENGGNFIDTANNYQGEESETWVRTLIFKKLSNF
jgi:predicted aldo/keto reductase-like oxidoreductase